MKDTEMDSSEEAASRSQKGKTSVGTSIVGFQEWGGSRGGTGRTQRTF
jgi:hypothetical protein